MTSVAMEHGVRLSRTSPAFLHANSTSHTWIFSAVAELIDNAYDPDVGASVLHIDTRDIGPHTCLVFTDDGNGMTAEKLHNMLSFGYCEKGDIKAPYKPVGQYGNGFKSGSMRLGKDAIVFTKGRKTCNVGFLSQTFLECIGASTVLVPIISFEKQTMRLIENREDVEGSIRSITQYSIFKSIDEIRREFLNFGNTDDRGTCIIIYNLHKSTEGMYELDFKSNTKDIINPEHHAFDQTLGSVRHAREYVPEYRRSLREYCSILFLKPRMLIVIRGEKVKTKLICKSLKRTEIDMYRPKYLSKPVKIVFGFNERMDDYGLMLYHRNRLIKAYEKIGCQKQANDQGKGVVGVVEVDFLEPIHNKQDFSKTDRYNAAMSTFAQKLNDYWFVKTNSQEPAATDTPLLDWTWAQCDNPKCLKWRRLPNSVSPNSLPAKWFCYMNLDATHNRCDIPEEPEDEDALLQQRASYVKTVKQKRSIEGSRQQKEKQEHILKERENRTNGDTYSDPLLAASNESAMARMEAELEESRKREERQRRIIAQLEQQKERWADFQKNCSNMYSSNVMNLPVTQQNLINQQPEAITTAIPASRVENSSIGASSDRRPGQLGRNPAITDALINSRMVAGSNPCSTMAVVLESPNIEDDDEMVVRDASTTSVVPGDENLEVKEEKVSQLLIVKLGKKRARAANNVPIVIESDSDGGGNNDDSTPVNVSTAVVPTKKKKTKSAPIQELVSLSDTISMKSSTSDTKLNSKSTLPVYSETLASVHGRRESGIDRSGGGNAGISGWCSKQSNSRYISSKSQLSQNSRRKSLNNSMEQNTSSQNNIGDTSDKIGSDINSQATSDQYIAIDRVGTRVNDMSSNDNCHIERSLSTTRSPSNKSNKIKTSASLSSFTDATVQTIVSGEQNLDQCSCKSRGSENCEVKLLTLRRNVARLLKTILPELECDEKDLDCVDDIIVEMIRVNVDKEVEKEESDQTDSSGHSIMIK